MNFFINKIRLWFNEQERPRDLVFLPNKVNVITSNTTNGKTSIWSIIDYCLMADKVSIPFTIIEKVKWFEIIFSIDDELFDLARRSPVTSELMSEVYFSNQESIFEPVFSNNYTIKKIKSLLDKKFGITDSMSQAVGKLSYRHLLIFNELTENLIVNEYAYFNINRLPKDDGLKSFLFEFMYGLKDNHNFEILSKLNAKKDEIEKAKKEIERNNKNIQKNRNEIAEFRQFCLENQLIEESEIENCENSAMVLATINDKLQSYSNQRDYYTILNKIDSYKASQREIARKLHSLTKWKDELVTYIANQNTLVDSILPIQVLKEEFSDEFLGDSDTNRLISELENSLKNIKKDDYVLATDFSKEDDEIEILKRQNEFFKNEIHNLESRRDFVLTEQLKYEALGSAKTKYEYISKGLVEAVDSKQLNQLEDELTDLNIQNKDIQSMLSDLKNDLNTCICHYFEKGSSFKLNSMKPLFDEGSYSLLFKINDKLKRSLGGKANFMFAHLCLFLGIHKNAIEHYQPNIANFMFIDQPSTAFFTNATEENDDNNKLVNVFSILNSFIDEINDIGDRKKNFQIIMVEHAGESYWIDNNFTNFVTVEGFDDNNGLIPNDIFGIE